MRISEVFTLNIAKNFTVPGNFFYLDSVPGGTVTVIFFKAGRALPEDLTNVSSGWYAMPDGGFDEVQITSTLTQTVAFYIAKGRVGLAVLGNVVVTSGSITVASGSITVANSTTNGAHVPAAVAVSNASVQLLAANAARKYLLIQNQHATANLYVRCNGTAAVADATCVKLLPGQSWEPPVAPTGEVRGIMDAATAGNTVHVIEV